MTIQKKMNQKTKMWEMWLKCATEQEIADELNVPIPTISRWIRASQNGQMSEMRTAFYPFSNTEKEGHVDEDNNNKLQLDNLFKLLDQSKF